MSQNKKKKMSQKKTKVLSQQYNINKVFIKNLERINYRQSFESRETL